MNPRQRFMFATGIECSNPVAIDVNGYRKRIDELDLTYHYTHWKHDLHLVTRMGLKFLRYGPPWYRVHCAPGRYDWEFTDAVFGEMRQLGIVPIVDLCHFGVPDWIGDFQNPDWPELFAEYAAAFATRFPWVRFYTPVNEIFVCAKLSTLVGLWNERARDNHRAFVTALKHLCRANLLAIERILAIRSDAIFIQSESAEYFHLGGGDATSIARARWENELRFLSLDLLFSHRPAADLVSYMFDNGVTIDEFDWFMSHRLAARIVMGNDYYDRNEQVIGKHGARPTGEVFGWAVITQQYYERYGRPVMHTETNTLNAADGPRWLWKEFYNVRYLRGEGVPVIGFTWYSLLDQVDWDSALARERGVVNAVGLFDLQRRPRPVASAYRRLLEEFGDEPMLPQAPESGRAYRLGDATNAPLGAGASRRRLSSVR
ncbi:MAG TPA: family 1 glycosylhydrolase [Vicinamibacterales bacterium]|nr:family 1 glycosylhydrolase [Vicinamibacterales bacterium]